MRKTYHGSCHCKKVRYQADIDLAMGSVRCNCSICAKSRYWPARIAPSAFRLLSGQDALTGYQFGERVDQHPFCMHCGVRAFSLGSSRKIGDFVSINLCCLDDASDAELAATPITYLNGRDDVWDAPPAETRHL
ncbi:MAG TPA: GFA family protein [Telluria sp.]|jgi:hypothetical protein